MSPSATDLVTLLPAPRPARHAAAGLRCGALLLALAAGLAGCGSFHHDEPPGVTDLAARPAERTLLAALRAYDDADYPAVERQADEALRLGLKSPHDQATAHKLKAFVFCTSNRIAACEAEFRAARAADPAFALTKAEAGHPVWGPVYQRSRQ